LFKEQGEELLLNFAERLKDYGRLDQKPYLEGKKMTILISPLSKKK
jgi:translation initiation factor IF-3